MTMAYTPRTFTKIVDGVLVTEVADTPSEDVEFVFNGWTPQGAAPARPPSVRDRVEDIEEELEERLSESALSATIGAGVAEVVEVQPVAGGPNTIIAGHAANAIASDVERSIILGGGTSTYNNVVGGDGANVDTTTPNTTKTGTGAHVSVVGGYDNSAGSLSSKIISDHSKTEEGGAGHNAIYGGAGHIARSAAQFAMIAGGRLNEVAGAYSFATGSENKANGQSSAVFGDHNTAGGIGTVVFGTTNTATGNYAAAFGVRNAAEGHNTVASGADARARTVSQQTFSGGKFATQGDAQTSVVEMHKKTTDATVTTLGVLQSGTSHQLLPNQSVAFEALIVARVEGGTDSAAFKVTGCYRRGATGTPAAVGTPTITTIGADTGASTWAVAMSADSLGGLNVRITGEAGRTIRWVQRMTLTEVAVA